LNEAGVLSGAQSAKSEEAIRRAIQLGLDILEGNPVPNRAYSGFPLLHYRAGEQMKVVDARTANVEIHQVWYDTHIESDTAFLDVRPVKDIPWTITYTIDVLNRGRDDFAPFTMYTDDPALSPGRAPRPHLALDQSFYNMASGTRTVFRIRMAPGKYFDQTDIRGWRIQPDRAQAIGNACKSVPFQPVRDSDDCAVLANTLVSWERSVFFLDGKPDKTYAIGKIGDYAPAKRMWRLLHDAGAALRQKQYAKLTEWFRKVPDGAGRPGPARIALEDWRHRDRLPQELPAAVREAIRADHASDLVLIYLNNTIYGQFTDGGIDYAKWVTRGTRLKIALYNGDYFDHGYQNADFGGARGWENQFQSSVKAGGMGYFETYGRAYWWLNIPQDAASLQNNRIPGVITVPAAQRLTTGGDQFGAQRVDIVFNYEPSRRLRLYQFDPVHHSAAIFAVH
jgi:hypothetical protein